MKVAKLSDVKDQLSRYVEEVRRGGRVRIVVHGKPAADLVPISGGTAAGDADLDELVRLGWVRRGTGVIPNEIFRPGPRVKGVGLSETVMAERKNGR